MLNAKTIREMGEKKRKVEAEKIYESTVAKIYDFIEHNCDRFQLIINENMDITKGKFGGNILVNVLAKELLINNLKENGYIVNDGKNDDNDIFIEINW